MRRTAQPPRDHIALTSVLYALSDPVRLEIVQCLAASGEQACSETPVHMPKSSLSHHYRVLRESGVIATRIEGTRHFNSLRCEDLDARFPGLLAAVVGKINTKKRLHPEVAPSVRSLP